MPNGRNNAHQVDSRLLVYRGQAATFHQPLACEGRHPSPALAPGAALGRWAPAFAGERVVCGAGFEIAPGLFAASRESDFSREGAEGAGVFIERLRDARSPPCKGGVRGGCAVARIGEWRSARMTHPLPLPFREGSFVRVAPSPSADHRAA